MQLNLQREKPTCNCGVFGIYGSQNASLETYYGLHALQHRGQEACGIVTKNISKKGNPVFTNHKGEGLVTEVFDDHEIFQTKLIGEVAIGHNRYSTTGSSQSIKNIQPFIVNYRLGNLAVAHNGNLTNAREIREE
nr:amidophosphoribosyltransferase [Ignavibacteriaceae bacterium]